MQCSRHSPSRDNPPPDQYGIQATGQNTIRYHAVSQLSLSLVSGTAFSHIFLLSHTLYDISLSLSLYDISLSLSLYDISLSHCMISLSLSSCSAFLTRIVSAVYVSAVYVSAVYVSHALSQLCMSQLCVSRCVCLTVQRDVIAASWPIIVCNHSPVSKSHWRTVVSELPE